MTDTFSFFLHGTDLKSQVSIANYVELGQLELAVAAMGGSLDSLRAQLHFVDVFLGRVAPLLTWDDGLEVMQILMTAYMSAQTEKTVAFPPRGLDAFLPDVAKGTWRP